MGEVRPHIVAVRHKGADMARSQTKETQASVTARLFLTIARAVGCGLLKAEKFGSCGDELILTAAIYVGQVEGKPMTASKLADYSGIPRPTVVRKLKHLQRRGIVHMNGDRSAALSLTSINDESFKEAIGAAAMRIRHASAELSKMDS